MAHSLPPAALAELYRSLGRDGSELPTTARHLASKLHSANVDGASAEAVTAVFEDVDALSSAKPTRSTDAMVTECVRRLRASGDGGEADLDQTCEPGVRVVPISGAAWLGHGTPEWVIPATVRTPNERLLFLHGGGYEYYSPSDVYRPLTTRIAAATGLPVLAVDYRLAPSHPFPAALEDALFALRYIWECGPPPSSPDDEPGACPPAAARASAVYLSGDSAGGGLALATIVALGLGELAPGLALPPTVVPQASESARRALLPTALALMSPWSDLTSSMTTYFSRAWDGSVAKGDPIFSDGCPEEEAASSVEGARRYGGETPLNDPRISPLFAPAHVLASWLPPTLIVVGDAEVMLGESTDFAARAIEARVAATQAEPCSAAAISSWIRLRIYRRMWHVFPMYTEACGQARASTVDSGALLCTQTDGLHHAWMALRDISAWLTKHSPSSHVDPVVT